MALPCDWKRLHKTPDHIRELLSRNLELDPDLIPYQLYTGHGPLGLADLMELTQLDKPALKYLPFLPTLPAQFNSQESMFDLIRWNDILLYHPYDSFNPVVDFVQERTHDPNVLAIKMTRYRVGSNSPIVQALKEAQKMVKSCGVMELKAPFFDEEKQYRLGTRLGRRWRTRQICRHRVENPCQDVPGDTQRSGRYSALYAYGNRQLQPTDGPPLHGFSFLPTIRRWARTFDLFNALTGYSLKTTYRKLLVAPWMRKPRFNGLTAKSAATTSTGMAIWRLK